MFLKIFETTINIPHKMSRSSCEHGHCFYEVINLSSLESFKYKFKTNFSHTKLRLIYIRSSIQLPTSGIHSTAFSLLFPGVYPYPMAQ